MGGCPIKDKHLAIIAGKKMRKKFYTLRPNRRYFEDILLVII